MKLLTFEYHQNGWSLEPMTFSDFDLLVGISGAGKSRIVRAIERVCAVALGTETRLLRRDIDEARGARFVIEFEHNDSVYRWEAEIEARPAAALSESDTAPPAAPLIRQERILKDGVCLVERDAEQFKFGKEILPRLDRAQSAISTLKEEPAVAPIHEAFSSIVATILLDFSPSNVLSETLFDSNKVALRGVSLGSYALNQHVGLHGKAQVLQDLFPDAFHQLSAVFQDTFPSVKKLGVERFNRRQVGEDKLCNIAIFAEEEGIERPIFFREMSSGMQRLLSFLVHLSFAPRGTVVLIDELETSFGVNCLPAAVDFLLSRAPDVHFVLTSHHPYIIDQIPIRNWKLVTRKGGRVRVLDASTIPALAEGRSHLDHFTRLLNLPEYENGVGA